MDIRDKLLSDIKGFNVCVDPMPDFKPEYEVQNDPIMETIYMEDPVTGKPRSDLSLVYSANVSDDVKQYIRSVLMQVREDSSIIAPDHETAVALHRDYGETLENYYDKVQRYVQSLNNKKVEDNG